jgi:hypothetical protein
MSHYVRCDRCSKEDCYVTSALKLPPGWERILNKDLCEPCVQIVNDFIRFKPGVTPVEEVMPYTEQAPAPAKSEDGTKLFETEPVKVSADSTTTPNHASNGEAGNVGTTGESKGETRPLSAESESSKEERTRTRKAKVRMQGQDAILPDKRTSFEHGHNAGGQA